MVVEGGMDESKRAKKEKKEVRVCASFCACVCVCVCWEKGVCVLECVYVFIC